MAWHSSLTCHPTFVAQDKHIERTFSIDPAVFEDDDQQYYLYFGGLWGGQLQNWSNGKYGQAQYPADNEPAILPQVAKLSDDMLELDEPVRSIEILNENGELILASDKSVTTLMGFGYINIMVRITYQGVVLEAILGWTAHHSISLFEDKWYLFYHDSSSLVVKHI